MRPNIVLICADQWRGDALSIEGHPSVRTPYLDALADRGTRCTRAYSASPTCVPARMTLFTGLSAASHGRVGYQDGVPFDVATTLAGEFKKAGYQTQAIGKMHVYPERARVGFDDVLLHDGYLHHSRGRGRPVEFYDDYLTWLRQQAGENAVSDYLDDGLHCNSVVARPWPRDERLHPTNWVVTKAIEWLYRRDPTVPFFLYLSFHRPHPPYDPPAWAFEQYLDDEPHPVPVGDWVADYAEFRNDHRPYSHVAQYSKRDMHRTQAGYYGHMSHIDGQVERFLEALGEFGIDDAYVAFTSDHGEMLGDHNMWRKAYPYEGSARIPFLLQGPGIPEGSTVQEVIELRDVMPTLLECAGLPAPQGIDGRSVLPLITTEDEPADSAGARATSTGTWREYLHGEHTVLGQSLQWIRTRRHKYVWLSGSGREQLFDLDADPQELHDLSADPDHAAVLARLRGHLLESLAGREEGYVADGQLVSGRQPRLVLAGVVGGRSASDDGVSLPADRGPARR
ncbi:arylsulfatase [Tessaracoccus sp. OH4464_COT-324]|uniref:arylsulfatase n=1 Tax=Tessaracoccus sp. OH4464_COT-324 TaxID=2491059 RepID=UPI000F6392B5|nr:arylsulfatase [Tessaracoccus sp. OH4464_COT-324]RRD45952.1 arylsulfatase [Tessaracoccus sp. OH4464_COT-324]